MKGRHILGSIILTRQSLSSVGKTIHKIGEDGKECHQQGVDSQHDGTFPGTCRRKEEVYCYEAYRTEENVLVQGKESLQGFRSKEVLAIIILVEAAVINAVEQTSHQESPPLGDDRTKRHAFHRHIASENQGERGDDVDHILSQRHHHRNACVLHTDVPACESIESEHGRRSPNTDIAVSASQLHDILLRCHRPQATRNDDFLKDEEQ